MAKRVPPTDQAQEEELTVTVVRFKGSGETARKGLDAVSQALAAAFGGATIVRQVNGRPKPAQLAAPAAPEMIDTEAVGDDEDVDDTEAEDVDTTQPAAGASTTAPRKLKPPKFDDKLDPAPWKAFAAERNPKTVDEKYLVACLWLQEHSGLDKYGPSQIYTCYKSAGWTIQVDFTQPIRTMKKDKNYFDKAAPRGEWKLNPNGLDVARQISNPAGA